VRQTGFVFTAMLFSTPAFMGPHSFALSGLWGGLLALLASWAMNLGTGLLLGEVLHLAQEAFPGTEPNYEAVGRLAFGPAFGCVAAFFCMAELFLYGVWWAVSFGINLPLLAQRAGLQLPVWMAVAMTTSIVVMGTLIPGKRLSYVAMASVSLLLGCAVMAMAASLALPEVATDQRGFVPEGLGSSFSIFTFGFAAHATFPSSYARLEEPRKQSYQEALVGAFVASLLGTAVLSAVVYLAYGGDSAPLCTANLGNDVHGHLLPQAWATAVQLAAVACFSLKSMASWPICLRPTGSCLAEALGWSLPAGVADEWELLPARAGLCLKRLLCNGLAAGACGLLAAILGDRIRLVTELTATTFMGMNAVVFPAACYVQLARDAGVVRRGLAFAVALMGGVMVLSPLRQLLW